MVVRKVPAPRLVPVPEMVAHVAGVMVRKAVDAAVETVLAVDMLPECMAWMMLAMAVDDVPAEMGSRMRMVAHRVPVAPHMIRRYGWIRSSASAA